MHVWKYVYVHTLMNSSGLLYAYRCRHTCLDEFAWISSPRCHNVCPNVTWISLSTTTYLGAYPCSDVRPPTSPSLHPRASAPKPCLHNCNINLHPERLDLLGVGALALGHVPGNGVRPRTHVLPLHDDAVTLAIANKIWGCMRACIHIQSHSLVNCVVDVQACASYHERAHTSARLIHRISTHS